MTITLAAVYAPIGLDIGAVKSGHGEKMECPGLLERFFNVFGRLVSKAKRNAADETLHLRRAIQTSA